MVRVHHDERFVESTHRLRVGHRQGAFKLPLSGSEIFAIRADGLGVPRRIVEQDHSPALDSFIPDNAGVAANALVSPPPFEHDAAPSPCMWDREAGAQLRIARRFCRAIVRVSRAGSQDTGRAKKSKNKQGSYHTTALAALVERISSATRPAGRVDCNRSAGAGFATAHVRRLVDLLRRLATETRVRGAMPISCKCREPCRTEC